MNSVKWMRALDKICTPTKTIQNNKIHGVGLLEIDSRINQVKTKNRGSVRWIRELDKICPPP
jgi:hypothetical protein